MHPLTARVEGGITFDERLPVKLEHALLAASSFPNPAFTTAKRLGKYTGNLSPTICVAQERDGRLHLPRGAGTWLRELAASHGADVRFVDARRSPSAPALAGVVVPPLRDYQAEAVRCAIGGTQGLLVLPTAAGKSRIGLGLVAELRTPTLILVSARDLAHQWCASVRETLALEPGLIGDGTNVKSDITIGIVQALARWPHDQLADYLGTLGCLLVDEAHRAASHQHRAIIEACPAKYRVGLTATPDRADGLGPVLAQVFGPVIYRARANDLADAGVLAIPQLVWVESSFTFPYTGPDDYAALCDALATDEARNRQIVDQVVAETADGNVGLVLSGRKDHCTALVTALQARGVAAELLTSDVSRRERARRLAAAKTGDVRVIVATSLADEGLDVPIVSRVFLTFPSRAAGRLLQRIGRAMRPHPDKRDAALIDVVDRSVPVLLAQARARRTAFRKAFDRGAGG